MTVVFIHGGVSGVAKNLPDIGHALQTTSEMNALDAVEHAVVALEDDPSLNAGYGAVLNRDGEVELDAGIAVGSRAFGAVACVTVQNPIRLARVVMETTPHSLLVGDGAEALARQRQLSRLEDTTPSQRRRWAAARASGELSEATFGNPEHVDTVGAVAVDDLGDTAAGSSTGGVFGQLRGRVGDAPIYGAGFYASPEVAVVGTGVGEVFLRHLACLRVAELVEAGRNVQEAVETVVGKLAATDASAAGLLALDSDGNSGAAYCGGSWAVWGPNGRVEPRKIS